MRKALNENPVVQISVLGLLVVVVGLFMTTRVVKKEETPAPESSSGLSSSASATGTPGTTTPTTINPDDGTASTPPAPSAAAPSAGGAGTVAPAPSAATIGGGTVTPEALIPGPGLPAKVVNAWKGGDAVVLLIVRDKGVDDRLVKDSVRSLSGDPTVAVFTAPAAKIARYSRITQGVGVSRVPALVVVRPKSVSGSVPEATVSYGFRNGESVAQAVHDALYEGRDDLPYSPG